MQWLSILLLPEAKPTGLVEAMSVCVCLCLFATRGVWKPTDVTCTLIMTHYDSYDTYDSYDLL